MTKTRSDKSTPECSGVRPRDEAREKQPGDSDREPRGFLGEGVKLRLRLSREYSPWGQGSRMKACDPMLGANFREIAASGPCLAPRKGRPQSRR